MCDYTINYFSYLLYYFKCLKFFAFYLIASIGGQILNKYSETSYK